MANEKLSPLQQELLSRADSIFASIGTAVGKATDFASVQIPDIAIQYVAYGRVYATVLMVFALTTFIFGMWLAIGVAVMDYFKAGCGRYHGYIWADSRDAAMILGIPISIVGFLMILFNVSNFIMVWFAPKIWLITELVKLAK